MQGDAPTPAGAVADAIRGNWVDTVAPPGLRPYLRLSRADRPIGTWLLLVPCWWGLALAILHDGRAGWSDLWIAAGCAAGAWLMRGAGCTWNDITDRNYDGAVARTRSRPIPSGQVTVKQAILWMCVQSLAALLILLSFPPAAIWLGFLALLPVAIYPFAKRFTWWPQIFLGIAFNWGALLGWAAHDGALGLPPILLYLCGIAWTLFYDTIYAHQDVEDDALIGIKSTARLFGERTAVWLRRFLIAATALMGAAIVLATPGAPPAQIAFALLAPAALGAHLLWQLRCLDVNNHAGLVTLFRSNRNAGLLATLLLVAAITIWSLPM